MDVHAQPAGAREYILGIETSCDETAAAIVAGGRIVRSSIVESQIATHAPFGGVVPEIAGRSHVRSIVPVIERAFAAAELRWEDVAAIAVTTRPGLIGSLLVGLTAAKAFAWAKLKPLVAIDHIEAHVHAATMERETSPYPCVALVVSGGHTALYRCRSPLELELVGCTMDDAAGEAFDKVAQILGLGYPGGPAIAKLALAGDPARFAFPRYRAKVRDPFHATSESPRPLVSFSFSGLKTSVLYQVRGQDARSLPRSPEDIPARADIAASFQEAVVDVLVDAALACAREFQAATVLVSGGVACNQRLREKMTAACKAAGLEAWFPSPAYCTDNAAMIAGLGWHAWRAGMTCALDLDASPRRG